MDDMTGVFKTAAFGGFQKDDVLNFIEMQKRTEADLRASVTELDSRLRELTERCRILEEEKKSISRELDENRDAREAASSLAIRNAEYQALEAKFRTLQEQNQSIAEENDSLRRALEEAKTAPQSAPRESAGDKSMEERVGSALVDARRFADQVMEEARRTAADANARPVRFAEDTEKKVQMLSAELRLCAEKCENLFAGVAADIERLRDSLRHMTGGIG